MSGFDAREVSRVSSTASLESIDQSWGSAMGNIEGEVVDEVDVIRSNLLRDAPFNFGCPPYGIAISSLNNRGLGSASISCSRITSKAISSRAFQHNAVSLTETFTDTCPSMVF